jgi:hypothetical protein
MRSFWFDFKSFWLWKCPLNEIFNFDSNFISDSVITQEYNESWLVMSVISADTCDCVHPWSAPWWTHIQVHVHWTIFSTSCSRQIFCSDVDNCRTEVVTFLVCSPSDRKKIPKKNTRAVLVGGCGGGGGQKTRSFSIRKEFKVIHVTLSMYLASLAFILCLHKKIEMTGIVTRTYPKSAPETYYTFTRKKSSDSFDLKEK